MKKTLDEILTRQYPKWSLPFRRILADMFRNRFSKKIKIDPWAYIMIGISLITGILVFFVGGDAYVWQTCIPFGISWVITALIFLYWEIFPLSWYEMYEYEKVEFRLIWNLPKDWEPKVINN